MIPSVWGAGHNCENSGCFTMAGLLDSCPKSIYTKQMHWAILNVFLNQTHYKIRRVGAHNFTAAVLEFLKNDDLSS